MPPTNQPSGSPEPSQNPVDAASQAESGPPQEAKLVSLSDLREQVLSQIARFEQALRAAAAVVLPNPPKPGDPDPIGEALGKVVKTYGDGFLRRIQQCQVLDEGHWAVEPSLVLSPQLDLHNDEFMEIMKRARSRWVEFGDLLRDLLLESRRAAHPPDRRVSPLTQAEIRAARAEVDALMVPASQCIDTLIPVVRGAYNKREMLLTERYNLDLQGEVQLLKPFLDEGLLVVELARSFASGQASVVSKQPAAGDSILNASAALGSKASSGGEAEPFSRRELAADLLHRLAGQLAEVLSAEPQGTNLSFDPETRKIVEAAFHQGALGIISLSFVLTPHVELRGIWREEFIRRARAAREALAPEIWQRVAPIFAAQAAAFGHFSKRAGPPPK